MSEDLNQVENALSNYSLTDAKIAELGELINPIKITDSASRKAASVHAKVMRDNRNGLEEFRLEHKRKLKKAGEKLDCEAKRIQGLMDPIEKGVKDKIKAWDDAIAAKKAEQERKEQERIENIKADINDNLKIDLISFQMFDVEVMEECLDSLENAELSVDKYQEFITEAIAARNKSIEIVTETIKKKKEAVEAARRLKEEQEAAEAQRKENERVAKELADAQRKIDEENKRKQDELDTQQRKIDEANAEIERKKQAAAMAAAAEEREKQAEIEREQIRKEAELKAKADAIREAKEAEERKAKEEEARLKAMDDSEFMEEYIRKVSELGYVNFSNDAKLTNEIRSLYEGYIKSLEEIHENIKNLIVVDG